MFLDVVNQKKEITDRNRLIQELVQREEHFPQWMEHPCSSILLHDDRCCEEARLWFLAYARSMEMGSLSQFQLKAPTWLSQLFTWGPTQWPIAWCQLVKEKVIDCGVFAALAREVFKAQGYEVHPAQALLSYNETCTNHWKDLWKTERMREGEVFPWIGTHVVYHELCVLEMPHSVARVYDSTWGNWYERQQRVGFGALLALRTECPRLLSWGDKMMSCGEWISV